MSYFDFTGKIKSTLESAANKLKNEVVGSQPKIDPTLYKQLQERGVGVRDVTGNLNLDLTQQKIKSVNQGQSLPTAQSGLNKITTVKNLAPTIQAQQAIKAGDKINVIPTQKQQTIPSANLQARQTILENIKKAEAEKKFAKENLLGQKVISTGTNVIKNVGNLFPTNVPQFKESKLVTPEKTTAEKAFNIGAKSLAKGALGAVKAIVEQSNLIRQLTEKEQSPIKKAAVSWATNKIFGSPILNGMDEKSVGKLTNLLDGMTQGLTNSIEKESATLPEAIQIGDLGTIMKSDDWLGYFLGSAAPSVGAAIAAAYASSPAVAAWALGAIQGGSEYLEAEKAGASELKQQTTMWANTIVSGLTEQLAFERLFKKVPNLKNSLLNTLKEGLINFNVEGGQEAFEQLSGNLFAKWLYDNKKDISDGLGLSYAIGGVTGAGIGATNILAGKKPKVGLSIEEVSTDKEGKPLTTKILKDLEGRETVSKQFISDLTKQANIKQVERDLINEALQKEGDKINASEFIAKVTDKLLPLKVESSKDGEPLYKTIRLDKGKRGNVVSYEEHVYESPVRTWAGNIHFEESNNYFGHTRVEDMADNKTRRVIEVQSDLYQKNDLKKEFNNQKILDISYDLYSNNWDKNQIERIIEKYQMNKSDLSALNYYIKRKTEDYIDKKALQTLNILREKITNIPDLNKDAAKLLQYNNPSAHFRMVREEIKRAADDGKTKLQFPTGETAMNIEGLTWAQSVWWTKEENPITLRMLKPGRKIYRYQGDIYDVDRDEFLNNSWNIVEVFDNGNFTAAPSGSYRVFEIEKEYFEPGKEEKFKEAENEFKKHVEQFNIFPKLDTSNPIYKFYETTLAKYLKSNYDAELVTDNKGVKWYEVDIKPEMKEAVVAFKRPDILDKKLVSGKQAIEQGKEIIKRLKLNNIDQQIVDVIFDSKRAEAFGAALGNKTYYEKEVPQFTGLHEIVHVIHENVNNIELFKKEGITKKELDSELKQMGTDDIREILAENAELKAQYKETVKPTSMIGRFLNSIKKWLGRIFKTDNRTQVQKFLDLVLEGKAKKETYIPEVKEKPTIITTQKGKTAIFKEGKFKKITPKQSIKKVIEGKIPEVKINTTEKKMLVKKLLDMKAGATVAKKVEQIVAKRQVAVQKRQTIREVAKTRKEQRTKLIEMFKQKETEISNIQREVHDYAKYNLPLEERGKALALVKNAKTKGQLAGALLKIDNITRQVKAKEVINEIEKLAKAPETLPLDARRKIAFLMDKFSFTGMRSETKEKLERTKNFIAQTKAEVPYRVQKEVSRLDKFDIRNLKIESLETLYGKLKEITDQGKTKQRVKLEIRDLVHEAKLKELVKGSKNLDITLKKRTPGQPLQKGELLDIKKQQVKNLVQSGDWQFTFAERFFDMLDGNKRYEGNNYKIFYHPVKKANDAYLNQSDKIKNEFITLQKNLGLDVYNYERIGIHAIREQKGGIEKLRSNGYSTKLIDSIQLNKNEMRMYNWMRQQLDALHPKIAEVYEKTYDKELGYIKNYFPFKTDFSEQVPTLDQIEQNYRRTSTERGFTKQRTGVEAPVRVDASAIFLDHINNATYFINIDPVIKPLARLASDFAYTDAVGKKAQKYVLDWIDVISRQGGITGQNNIEVLDTLRRNAAVAVLGLKLSSAVIQPVAKLNAGAELGSYTFRYDKDFITNKDIRKFVVDTSAQMRHRIGDDPAYLDLSENKKVANIQHKAMWLLQQLDSLTAGSVWYGAYRKYLNENNIQFDLNKPNEQASDYADRVVRLTQVSSDFKDLPFVMTSKQRSINRTLLTFQTFMLGEWNYIKHDLIKIGITDMKEVEMIENGESTSNRNTGDWNTGDRNTGDSNTGDSNTGDWNTNKKIKAINRMSKQLLWLIAAAAAEQSIRTGLSYLYYGQDFEKMWQKIIGTVAGKVPVISQIESLIQYESVPVPLLNTLEKIGTGGHSLLYGESAKTKIRGGVKVFEGLGSLVGIPGSSELSKIIRGRVLDAMIQERS